MGDADYRTFQHWFVLADGIFQCQGGDPLTTGFDGILVAVGYHQIAFFVNITHITGIEPVIGPQFPGLIRFMKIFMGTPGSPDNHIAHRFPVPGQFLKIIIDNFRLGEDPGDAAFDQISDLVFLGQVIMFRFQLPQGHSRTGLGHAVC